jgi:Tol biopolymer transport system component
VSGQDCGEGDPGYLKSIYVANLDGTGKRRVTSGATALRYDMEPAWHPGTRIAFAGFDDGLSSSDIYMIEPDGSGLQRLTDTGRGYAWEPQWKPDGEWVVFSHDPDPEGRQICIVRADGTGYECLTDGPFYHGYPSWSASP